jgi:hypothetical protein
LCRLDLKRGRRNDFEGVQYEIVCSGLTGGRFTIEVFENVRLRNGWKVSITLLEEQFVVANWEVEPAKNGTDAYGRVHLALDGGQNVLLEIRIVVEGRSIFRTERRWAAHGRLTMLRAAPVSSTMRSPVSARSAR